jgi:hypothetical protein
MMILKAGDLNLLAVMIFGVHLISVPPVQCLMNWTVEAVWSSVIVICNASDADVACAQTAATSW